MKKLWSTIFNKVTFLYSALAVQVLVMLIFIIWFSNYLVYFYIFCIVLSIISVLMIVYNRSSPEYKIPLIILILLFPIVGGVFYLIFGVKKNENKQWRKMFEVEQKRKQLMKQSDSVFKELQSKSKRAARQSHYLYSYDFSPIYKNTEVKYLPLGEVKHIKLLQELKKAEKYIFMEYFIIAEGQMWNSILEILLEKVAEGCEG